MQQEIVIFYPQYEQACHLLRPAFKDEAFESWSATKEVESTEKKLQLTAYSVGLELLFYCSRFGATYAVDSEPLEFVLGAIVEFGQAWAGGAGKVKADTKRDIEQRALRRLAVVPLNRFDRLSVGELALVREDSEGFQKWRSALEEGLLRIESDEVDTGTLEAAVRDSLAAGEIALQKTIEKSTLLSKTNEAGGTFILGAMSALIAGSSTHAGLETGAVTASLKILWDFVERNRTREKQRALMKHYSLWTQT